MLLWRLGRTHGCTRLLCIVVAVAFDMVTVSAAGGPNAERMEACEPRTCGADPNVSYPFWIDGLQPAYCGQIFFRVTCGGDRYPVLPISEDNYYVHDICYVRRSLDIKKRVIRSLGANNTNSSNNYDGFPNRNLTLDRTPFNVTDASNSTLLFLFNCNMTLMPPVLHPAMSLFPLSCTAATPGFPSFVGYMLPRPIQLRLLEACAVPVTLPVTPFPPGVPSYPQLLDFRITLNWTAPDCTKCTNSGGHCGTNLMDNAFNFICICSDRDHRVSCASGP